MMDPDIFTFDIDNNRITIKFSDINPQHKIFNELHSLTQINNFNENYLPKNNEIPELKDDVEKWELAPYSEYKDTYVSTHGRVMTRNGYLSTIKVRGTPFIRVKNKSMFNKRNGCKSQARRSSTYIQFKYKNSNTRIFVDELVIATFVGKEHSKKYIIHIDGDMLNNKLSNLLILD